MNTIGKLLIIGGAFGAGYLFTRSNVNDAKEELINQILARYTDPQSKDYNANFRFTKEQLQEQSNTQLNILLSAPSPF